MSKSIINFKKIRTLLSKKAQIEKIDSILEKSKKLERLSLEEVSTLLNVENDEDIQKIFETAKWVKNEIYGKRLVLFAPLYISNECFNDCTYCAFRSKNKDLARVSLSQDEIKNETMELLKTGQKRVLLVSGEAHNEKKFEYILESIKSIYSVKHGKNSIRRLNVNIAPVSDDQFKRLKDAQIGTYQLFQETYHKETYEKVHLTGPKSNYDYRLETIDRVYNAGIDDVGIGVLFGLYDYKFEMLSLMSHIEHLEMKYGMGPHTISVPRIEPATGSSISENPPYPVSDKEFLKIIAILRLAVPYIGLILSTRETEFIRREGISLGISQISAGSRTNPGGYGENGSLEQFSLGDHRSLDEVVSDICEEGYIPSFCTSCYRLGRTGHDFMDFAKPGEIKQKCLPNALFTLKEFLEDYASIKSKKVGEKTINEGLKEVMDKDKILRSLEKINNGKRDIFV
jgi:2-iminoacetate synthase